MEHAQTVRREAEVERVECQIVNGVDFAECPRLYCRREKGQILNDDVAAVGNLKGEGLNLSLERMGKS